MQNLIERIETFCDDLCRLKTLCDAVDTFTSVPVSKADVKKFINSYSANPLICSAESAQMLVHLTTGPSEYNGLKFKSCVYSYRSAANRRLCSQLGKVGKGLTYNVLSLIKSGLDEINGDDEKMCELKRCMLILPLLFIPDRDVTVRPESLDEIEYCQEEACQDSDTILRCVKEKLDEKMCNVFLSENNIGCCPVLNCKNWESISSLVVRANAVVDA